MALSHLATRADKPSMQTTRSIYHGFCFPPEVIAHAVFLYHRFPLSLRDVEDLLAQRGIAVSYETIRRWCRRFGPLYARNVRRQRPTAGEHWLLDEVFLQIQGRCQYLWRAIDQDGDILDILMQRRRNGEQPHGLFVSCSNSNNGRRIGWSRTSWPAIASRIGRREQASPTIRRSTQTIESKHLTAAPESESDRCCDFGRPETHNGFSVFKRPY